MSSSPNVCDVSLRWQSHSRLFLRCARGVAGDTGGTAGFFGADKSLINFTCSFRAYIGVLLLIEEFCLGEAMVFWCLPLKAIQGALCLYHGVLSRLNLINDLQAHFGFFLTCAL